MPLAVVTVTSTVPGTPAAPGANVPPELICVLPTEPVPIRVAPFPTVVKLEEAIEPVTSSLPELTLVAPV